jgi:formylglycine-generating enzyme required for sulfatase activity
MCELLEVIIARMVAGIAQMAVLVAIAACVVGGQAKAQTPQAGEVFRDCSECPRMIVIPGGTFEMGSPSGEAERYANEGPLRTIAVSGFAMSRTEITRAQFAAFARETNRPAEGGCYTPGDLSDLLSDLDKNASWRNPGYEQTRNHPVACISWHDAKDYADWLSRKTGRVYRLPSEAEWEYAARAGSKSPYYWGDGESCTHMNGGDLSLGRAWPRWAHVTEAAFREGESGSRLIQCEDGAVFTAAVGRYEPNAFGLHDMTGNLWEWVEDCSRTALPEDSRAQTAEGCERRRTRGGSWDDWPKDLRSATRKRLEPDARRNDVGIRLVCELSDT